MFDPIYYIRSNYRHDPSKIRLVKAADKARELINEFKQAFERVTGIHFHRWTRWKTSGGVYGLFTGKEHRRCRASNCNERQTRAY